MAAASKGITSGNVTSIRERQFLKLETQKDGRLFAIDLLRRMKRRWGIGGTNHDDYSAESIGADSDGEYAYRTGPQSDILLRAFDELATRAKREAILGFHVVLTDFIGSAIAGALGGPELYAALERDGKLEPWGTVRDREASNG